MKRIILLAGGLLMLGALTTSCKKDYVCQCSKTYTDGSGSSTNNYSMYTYRDTRSRAEGRCNENTKSGSDLGGNYSVNCQIQ
jgi:hypothetical protein